MGNRPICKCHGEPMARNGIYPVSRRQKYQCSVKNRDRVARWYENCTEYQANFRRLRDRRLRAVMRMKARANG